MKNILTRRLVGSCLTASLVFICTFLVINPSQANALTPAEAKLPIEAWNCIKGSKDIDSCLYCDKSCKKLPTDKEQRECSQRVWCLCTNKFEPSNVPDWCKKLGIPGKVGADLEDF